MRTGSRLVTLKGGFVVPLHALELAWDLEHRGCRLALDADDLIIGPRDLLSEQDRAAIRKAKPWLVEIIRYVDVEGWRA